MRMILLVVLTLQCLATNSQSNCWRGLTPLRSTCDDVKRILNVETCTTPISRYTLPDYRVMVEFANNDCEKFPRAWRVASGTVVAITLSPRMPVIVSQFDLDLSRYKKREDGDVVGISQYDNEEDGVTVETFQGNVLSLFLYPRKSDEPMRCRPAK